MQKQGWKDVDSYLSAPENVCWLGSAALFEYRYSSFFPPGAGLVFGLFCDC